MNPITALQQKFDQRDHRANLVAEVSLQLSTEYARHIQSKFIARSATDCLALAVEQVNYIVADLRKGGALPPMTENVIGPFMLSAKQSLLQALIEQFDKAVVIHAANQHKNPGVHYANV